MGATAILDMLGLAVAVLLSGMLGSICGRARHRAAAGRRSPVRARRGAPV